MVFYLLYLFLELVT